MKILTEHPTGRGLPVILNDDGNPMEPGPGVAAIRRRLGLSTAELGARLCVSPRTVEDWEQGRHKPRAPALLLLSSLLSGRG